MGVLSLVHRGGHANGDVVESRYSRVLRSAWAILRGAGYAIRSWALLAHARYIAENRRRTAGSAET